MTSNENNPPASVVSWSIYRLSIVHPRSEVSEMGIGRSLTSMESRPRTTIEVISVFYILGFVSQGGSEDIDKDFGMYVCMYVYIHHISTVLQSGLPEPSRGGRRQTDGARLDLWLRCLNNRIMDSTLQLLRRSSRDMRRQIRSRMHHSILHHTGWKSGRYPPSSHLDILFADISWIRSIFKSQGERQFLSIQSLAPSYPIPSNTADNLPQPHVEHCPRP